MLNGRGMGNERLLWVENALSVTFFRRPLCGELVL